MIDFSYSTETVLVASGFSRSADGALRAPTDSTVTLNPIDGRFFRLAIELPGGAAVTAVLAAAAIRICHEGTRP